MANLSLVWEVLLNPTDRNSVLKNTQAARESQI